LHPREAAPAVAPPATETEARSTLWPESRELVKAMCTDRELEALRLHAHGMDYEQIALTLGISPEGARSRIRRGRAKIRQSLMLR
jgi:DNA-directed RNA polymerase specialized sigma24 family protein